MKKIIFNLILLAFLLSSYISKAQLTWDYKSTSAEFGYYISEADNGSYIVAGGNGIVKIGNYGDLIWNKPASSCYRVISTKDGNYAACGSTFLPYILKIDENGNQLWLKYDSTMTLIYELLELSDSGLLYAGYRYYNTLRKLYVCKTDETGNKLWQYSDLSDTLDYYSFGAVEVNNFIFAYATNYQSLTKLIKLDFSGNLIWSKTYSFRLGASKPAVMSGDGQLVFFTDNYSPSFVKLNTDGDTVFVKTSNVSGNEKFNSIELCNDNGFIVAGMYGSWSMANTMLYKFDSAGNYVWEKHYCNCPNSGWLQHAIPISNGYITTGAHDFNSTKKIRVIKVDLNGELYTNKIIGNVYWDLNQNCIKDTNEQGIPNQKIYISPGNHIVITDQNGDYVLQTMTGNYSVSQLLDNPYVNVTCPSNNTYNVTSGDHTTVTGIDFADYTNTFCPYLTVDLISSNLRPCLPSHYYVKYCNYGTSDASNAYVEIDFDPLVNPISSSIPWTNINGNVYTFDLGTIAVGDCGTFTVNCNVSCSAIVNQTLCTEAHIYPDSVCTPPDPSWDKSSVSVTGYCDNDNYVCFVIENTGDPGDGDMEGPSQYRVYEDNVLIYSSTFQINGGDTMLLCFPANGHAIRLEADQRPGHPGNSQPRETIELCGDDGNPSLGQILQVPEDDEDEFVEIDCHIVTASFDPNDKYAKPEGVTQHHYISDDTQMEYQIDFQNTGNDTAFTVIIRDTLSPYLDITTIKLGISSHPYTFQSYHGGVMEFRFDNILLPDSGTNEPASHGFVKYKINQIPGNPIRTNIANTAEIYFDFNAPVVTNTVVNVVFDLGTLTNLYGTLKLGEIEFNAWPNPASGNVNISFTLPQQGKVLLNVYNGFGMLCNTVFNGLATAGKVYDIDYNTAALPQGIYFVVIKGDNFSKTIKLIVAGE